MTAKEETLSLMKQIPDHLTADEAIVEIMRVLPDDMTFEDAQFEPSAAFKIERG
jgi:hypothetical protein